MFSSSLSALQALVLGIVEGVTEFLPVSSTGHLLVVGELIGFGTGSSQAAGDTYSIAIQFGAILAVLVLYRDRVFSMLRGLAGKSIEGRLSLTRLIVAFVPAAVLGVVAGDAIKEKLFGPIPVTIAWFVGGVLLLRWNPKPGALHMQDLPVRAAFIIGCAQGLALWPGVSRSLITLVAGLAVGMSLAGALEFSFLLGLVTLSAATFLDITRNGGELFDTFGYVTPFIGVVAAFVTAVIAVRWMVDYLAKHSLALFGYYRIAIAAICTVLLLTGVL